MSTMAVAIVGSLATLLAVEPTLEFAERPGQVAIAVGGQPLAVYVYADKEITRPYFAHVHVPGGIQVTRNHPPIEGKDATDHATFHPGIWLAFGDIEGQDYWRLKARVRHDRFVEAPKVTGRQGSFTVQNSYCRADDPEQIVCRETCRYTVSLGPTGYLLVCDSLFHSAERPFAFGDQEEMGLGVRVTTPIAVKSGGTITDAMGRVNEKQIWGHAARWCDYSGVVDGRRIGILVMPDPANFRPSRFHARDYGLLAANPFGQKVFGDAEASRVPVRAGEDFRLRFGVLLHANPADQQFDPQAAYEAYLRQLSGLPRPTP